MKIVNTLLTLSLLLITTSCGNDDKDTPNEPDNTQEVLANLEGTYWYAAEKAVIDSDGHELTDEEWRDINHGLVGGPCFFYGFYFGQGFVRIYTDMVFEPSYWTHEISESSNGKITFAVPYCCENIKILSATPERLVVAYLEDNCLYDKEASQAAGKWVFKKGAYFLQTLVPATELQIQAFNHATSQNDK